MTAESFILISILTGSLIILLKHWPLFLAQLGFQILALNMNGAIFTICYLLQILFGLWIFYRLIRAVDYNYSLEMDQTERIPQKYTEGGRLGRKKHFLF